MNKKPAFRRAALKRVLGYVGRNRTFLILSLLPALLLIGDRWLIRKNKKA